MYKQIELPGDIHVEVVTRTVTAHSLMTDYPDIWEEIGEFIIRKMIEAGKRKQDNLVQN